MKKVFLLTAVAGMVAFTSCKKETHEEVEHDVEMAGEDLEDGAHATGAAIEDGANDVAEGFDNAFEDAKAWVTDAPEIENDQLQEWVNKLHDAAAKAKAAADTGMEEELNEAVAEMTSLAESLNSFQGDAQFDEAQAYYNEVKAEVEQETM